MKARCAEDAATPRSATPIHRIGAEDVAAWFDAASKDKPGAANRAPGILLAMMFRAEEWGLRARASNPCLGIAMNRASKLRDSLTGTNWLEAVAAILLLALTGCRRSEVLDLRWRYIGNDALHLPDMKTGPRAVPLGEAAQAHVAALPGNRDSDAFVFPNYATARVRFVARLLAHGLHGCEARQPSPA